MVSLYTSAHEGAAHSPKKEDNHHKLHGVVTPGGEYTYSWDVPEQSRPGKNDPTSIVGMYHCHVNDHISAGMVTAYAVE